MVWACDSGAVASNAAMVAPSAASPMAWTFSGICSASARGDQIRQVRGVDVRAAVVAGVCPFVDGPRLFARQRPVDPDLRAGEPDAIGLVVGAPVRDPVEIGGGGDGHGEVDPDRQIAVGLEAG